jgi:hypothetical protein
LSIACLAWAKFPDVMAFSIARPVELELVCSDFTSLHMALLGFDPLVFVEWCFELWVAAEAAVSGARASMTPSAPVQTPTHLDRCFTAATSRSGTRRWTLQHPFRLRGVPHGPFDLLGGGFGLNRIRAGVMVGA